MLLWLAGSLVTLLQIELLAEVSAGKGFEPLAVARSLVAGQGFANPYMVLATGPTAHCAPVYPSLVAACIRLFGEGEDLALLLVLLHVLLHGLQFALLPLVSLRLIGDRKPGYIAAGLLCLPLIPVIVQFETMLLGVSLLLCVIIPVLPWSAVPAALLGALSLHINPSGIFLLAGWIWWKKPDRRWLAIYAVTLAAACIPWTIRNYQTFGTFFFVRDNLPLELYVSNNDVSQSYMSANLALRSHHPNASLTEAMEVKRMGEAAYMADRLSRTRAWIQGHPTQFLQLSAARAWLYWFPRIDKRPWQAVLLGLITLVSIPGMFHLRRHPLFISVFVFSPILYYSIQAEPHYRYPFFWATLLAAGVTLSKLQARLKRPRFQLESA